MSNCSVKPQFKERGLAMRCSELVFSRSHDAVIHVYDEARNVIETHEHAGDFNEW